MPFQCHQKVNDKISNVFAWYGRKVARRPWAFIIICVLVNSLLGIGLMRLEILDDTEKIFTPENSQAFQDRDKAYTIFYDIEDTNFYQHNLLDAGYYGSVIIKPRSGDVLSPDFMDEVETLYNYVMNIKGTYEGAEVTYDDVCARRNSKCVISGSEYLESSVLNQLLLKNISYPQYETLYVPQTFGMAQEENGLLVSADAFKLRFNLGAEDSERITKWQEQFILSMEELITNKTDVAYEHSFSLDEELNANLLGDISLFAVTFTMMCTYASLATIRANCLADRSTLGLAGVFATVLAILGAFGLCSACGVKIVNIVGVAPFLVVGIGVDDMFILLSGMAEAIEHHTDIEDRAAHMMKTSGLGITITSLTDFLGFLIGSTSIFPAIQYFCIYSGVAILFCYANHVTFFTSCIVIDQRRIAALRHSKTCLPIKVRGELEDKGAGKAAVYCCSGDVPKKREDVESPLESYPRRLFTFLSLTKPLKPIIMLIMLVYWGIAIWGAVFFEEGFLVENIVHSESYAYKYQVWDRENYEPEVMVTFIVDETLDYTSANVRQNIQDLITDAQQNQYINSAFELSWLRAYSNFPLFSTTTKEDFALNLKLFFNDSSGKMFANDVVFSDSSPVEITACRVYIRSLPTSNTKSQSNIMVQTRDIAQSNPISVFAYAPSFTFFEQYLNILPQTMQTLGVVAASIFVITIVFMPHPFIIILVTVAVTSIMTGLVGFMYFWDLTLSSITMVHIIMSIGFSVDYSAHICHAFIIAEEKTRSDKVRSAMNHAGGPVFSGAFSSFIGIIVLAFSSSYIFQSFFKVMLTVIIIGTVHALLFLPVIISLIGPLAPGSKLNTINPTEERILSLVDFRIPRPSVKLSSGHMSPHDSGVGDMIKY